ncbi:MAG: B12-binding domain-containing radical SAM protein, partial [Elusimicrobiota bacterium]
MKFLLINPYICDFACYDYWMKPLGLLYLSSILKEKGHKVNLIDCMDRNHPYLPKSREKKFGRGKFYSKEREKPEILKKYPRKYKIYGLYGQKLYNLLKSMEKPDIVVMTSTMTYWYPGTKETADMVKDVYKDVPLILGGIYPSLCKDHARKTVKADYIFTGSGFEKLFSFIGESCPEFSEWPAPDYNFYKNLGYAVIRTSIGCHRNCSYCGIKNIYKGYESKKADTIGSEIEYLKNLYGIDNFVFYDDSLLENE